MKKSLILVILLLVADLPALATNKNNESDALPACKQIKKACKKSGFVNGGWKQGKGLWRNCINPVVQGQTAVESAFRPLPMLDAKIVDDCKSANPRFGMGKIGSRR